ncbi:uncharacterized protein B0J16DRAFT_198850 [Fusarium flagelliforme]|uniref:uncharacterized protein n=1 Tax=Fusarium flagelliforme TaxID=2675880 RepID=UPI001E8E0AFE|nr:uncharacterized protein B0J16DRAFT_198850 [Fusarium flagelliforme]KAH7173889.1 hypothetical protein B0J16DRAFT_198850 [Fusarium flagelliforme]
MNHEQVFMVQHALTCRAHGHQPLGHPVDTTSKDIAIILIYTSSLFVVTSNGEISLKLSGVEGAWDLGEEVRVGSLLVYVWVQCGHSVIPLGVRFEVPSITSAWFNLIWSAFVEEGSCPWMGAEEGCAIAPRTMSWNSQAAFRQTTIHLLYLLLILCLTFSSVMETRDGVKTVLAPQQSCRARNGFLSRPSWYHGAPYDPQIKVTTSHNT